MNTQKLIYLFEIFQNLYKAFIGCGILIGYKLLGNISNAKLEKDLLLKKTLYQKYFSLDKFINGFKTGSFSEVTLQINYSETVL